MSSTTRISSEERRREIVEAATEAFAIGGLDGTPVTDVAERVGVSQPYLFKLFGTKKELFIAAVRRAFERTLATFERAAAGVGEGSDSATVLRAMGSAYHTLLEDRTLLLMQLQAYAASGDPEVREAVRSEFVRLVDYVRSASGADDEAVRSWLAEGMLMNVSAALDLPAVQADWAQLCLEVPGPSEE